jgi:hypothetical protein
MGVITQRGVHLALGRNVDEVRGELGRAGWTVLVLPPEITDKASFFDAMCAGCPLDPPLMRVRLVWDALSDSLWGGLDALEADKVAVLWPQSGTMEKLSPVDYAIARDVMSSVATSLMDTNATVGEPTYVAFVLL